MPVQWKEDIEEKVRTALTDLNESDEYNANLNQNIKGKYYNLNPSIMGEKEQNEIVEV